MRINLTKKDLVNLVYMQLGFSKQVSEKLIEEFFFRKEKVPKLDNFNFFSDFKFEMMIEKKSSIRFSEICFEKPNCI